MQPLDKSGNLSQVRGGAEIRTKPYSGGVSRNVSTEHYPACEVLRGWQDYLHRRSGVIISVRGLPQPIRSNCPTKPAADITPTMWAKVEIFFYRNLEWIGEKRAAEAGQVTDELFDAWESWYAADPIPLPEGSVSDDYMDMVDIVDRWNGMYPGDPITYDALRKAKSEHRVGYRLHLGRVQCSMADIALWRSQTMHGGRREGAGRKPGHKAA